MNALDEDLRYIVNYNLPYDNLKNHRVLVTGATGFIGVSLIRSMLAIGNIKVVAFVRDEEKAKGILPYDSNLDLIIGDVTNRIRVVGNIDYIFHCASITASKLMIEKPVETLLISAEGTKNVLELAKEKKTKAVVYISSMEMYGTFFTNRYEVKETDSGYIDPLKIRSNYSESKRFCENMCIAYMYEYGVPVRIARLAQTFGAGILPGENRVFAQFAKCLLEGKNIVLHTNGLSEGNYCYIRDCITGLFTILLKGKDGEAYNVSNPDMHATILEMAKMVVGKIANNKIEIVFDIPENNKYGYAANTKMLLNSDKLKGLGWNPEIDLEQSFRRMIECM